MHPLICHSYYSVLRQRLRCHISFLESCRRSTSQSLDVSKASELSLSWYWDTIPPTAEHLKSATEFFRIHPPRKLWTATEWRRTQPRESSTLIPEVAFIGRSNVGKSSLLNALLLAPQLNHVGARPGKTNTMHAWGLAASNPLTGGAVKGRNGEMDVKVAVLDMPGYGYASRDDWGAEIMTYFKQRKQLRRVFVLMDPLHGIKASDYQMLELLRRQGISHQVIASKCDRLEGQQGQEKLRESLLELQQIIESTKMVGTKALGEILAVGSLGDGRKNDKVKPKLMTGVEEVRWAVLVAAGLEEWATKRKVKQPALSAVESNFMKMLLNMSAKQAGDVGRAEGTTDGGQDGEKKIAESGVNSNMDSIPPFVPIKAPHDTEETSAASLQPSAAISDTPVGQAAMSSARPNVPLTPARRSALAAAISRRGGQSFSFLKSDLSPTNIEGDRSGSVDGEDMPEDQDQSVIFRPYSIRNFETAPLAASFARNPSISSDSFSSSPGEVKRGIDVFEQMFSNAESQAVASTSEESSSSLSSSTSSSSTSMLPSMDSWSDMVNTKQDPAVPASQPILDSSENVPSSSSLGQVTPGIERVNEVMDTKKPTEVPAGQPAIESSEENSLPSPSSPGQVTRDIETSKESLDTQKLAAVSSSQPAAGGSEKPSIPPSAMSQMLHGIEMFEEIFRATGQLRARGGWEQKSAATTATAPAVAPPAPAAAAPAVTPGVTPHQSVSDTPTAPVMLKGVGVGGLADLEALGAGSDDRGGRKRRRSAATTTTAPPPLTSTVTQQSKNETPTIPVMGKGVGGMAELEALVAGSDDTGGRKKKRSAAVTAAAPSTTPESKNETPALPVMGKGVGGMAELEALVTASDDTGGRKRKRSAAVTPAAPSTTPESTNETPAVSGMGRGVGGIAELEALVAATASDDDRAGRRRKRRQKNRE